MPDSETLRQLTDQPTTGRRGLRYDALCSALDSVIQPCLGGLPFLLMKQTFWGSLSINSVSVKSSVSTEDSKVVQQVYDKLLKFVSHYMLHNAIHVLSDLLPFTICREKMSIFILHCSTFIRCFYIALSHVNLLRNYYYYNTITSRNFQFVLISQLDFYRHSETFLNKSVAYYYSCSPRPIS